LFKTIHLIQQFNEYSLNLPISSCLGIKTLGGYWVNLINEYDGRWIFFGHLKNISNHPWTFS
jgi:hypothetical protein